VPREPVIVIAPRKKPWTPRRSTKDDASELPFGRSLKIAFFIPRLIVADGGTERASACLIEQLAVKHHITVFTSAIMEVELPGVRVRRVATLLRPVVLHHLSFLLASRAVFWWDRLVRGARYDIIQSPGINVFAADVITAHWCQAEADRRAAILKLDSHSVRALARRLTRAAYRGLPSEVSSPRRVRVTKFGAGHRQTLRSRCYADHMHPERGGPGSIQSCHNKAAAGAGAGASWGWRP
jgi:hypothetical protein